MRRKLIVHRAGPGLTVQDLGRPGYLAFGLSRGGAADRLAIAEGAALLGQSESNAALEMAGIGGEFEATEDMRIALTGAPMRTSIDGTRLIWNASYHIPRGTRLSIGATESGTYGYLHIGGGLATNKHLGARATHVAAGIGAPVGNGAHLPIGDDIASSSTGLQIEVEPRFQGGQVRVVPSLQTDLFDPIEIARFQATVFRRDVRGNRMGVQLAFGDRGFHSEAGLRVISEIIVPGDIQITGDGTPFVLLGECQTTGGYPRIGSVIPSDLPRVVQARPGAVLRFCFVTLEEAVAVEKREQGRKRKLRSTLRPLVRDPSSISDLLSYQLVSGATVGDDSESNDL